MTNTIKNGQKDLSGYFSKEYVQMTNKFMKICSVSLVIREVQIKPQCDATTYPTHYTLHPLQWLSQKRQVMSSVSEKVEKLGSCRLLAEMLSGIAALEKSLVVS